MRNLVCSLVAVFTCTASFASSPPSAGATSLAVPAKAVVHLNTRQLLERVLPVNADLRAALQSVLTAQAGVLAASARPNPRIELQTGPQRNLTGAPGVGGINANAITLAQPIENPQLRNSRIEAAQAAVRVDELSSAELRNDIAARVRLLAYESVLREEEARAAAEAEALLEQVRQRVRLRVETGEAARYEIIKADAELTGARQRRIQAELLAEQVRLRLNRLAGGNLPLEWRFDGSLDEPVPERDAEPAADAALQFSPALRTLAQHLVRKEALVREARASVRPAVDLLLTQSREPGMRQQMAGIGVTVPLFDRRQGQIAAAESERQRAFDLLEGRKAEWTQEWRLAVKSLEMAQSRVRSLSQGAVREAEAALRVAEAAYRFGERGILDVLDAQRVLRAVRSDLLQAKYEVRVALIEIDRLRGVHAQPLT